MEMEAAPVEQFLGRLSSRQTVDALVRSGASGRRADAKADPQIRLARHADVFVQHRRRRPRYKKNSLHGGDNTRVDRIWFGGYHGR